MFIYLILSGNNNAQYAVGSVCIHISFDYGFYGPTIGNSLSYIPDGFWHSPYEPYLISGGNSEWGLPCGYSCFNLANGRTQAYYGLGFYLISSRYNSV